MASLNSNSVSGITTDIFSPSQGVNKKYIDDNIPTLPSTEKGGGKFLVTTDGVSITWSDISNVEEFAKVGISTYYIPEMASAVHIEAVGGGQAGNNPKGSASDRADDAKMEFGLGCRYWFGCGWRHVGDAIYADGYYALTRSCGNPIFSTDGFIWSARTVGLDVAPASPFYDQKDTNSIDYHDGLWLIAGRNNFDSTCMTTCGFAGVSASTDTFHWSLRTLANPSSNKYSFTNPGGLKYLNDLWYLVAQPSTCSVQVSTDTIHWTLRTAPSGGGRIQWSGEHYAYANECGAVTSSTDGIHWFKRTMAYMDSGSGRNDATMLSWHDIKNVWVSVTHAYTTACSPYAYAEHIHTSTDSISWTLRTFPFNTNAAGAAPGCSVSDINHHQCGSINYGGLVSVGNYLYLNGCSSRCSGCSSIMSDTFYMYAPLFSTDGIIWMVDEQSPNVCSPFAGQVCYFCNDSFYYRINENSNWPHLYNVNNRLLIAGEQSYRGILLSSETLSGSGSGGSGGNYALFSVDPKTVIDRKLEINVGAGGTASQEDFQCGCVGAGTTISYLSQEGTTSYYFAGNGCINYGTSSRVGGFTGPYTIEFWMRADANCNSVSDVIIESHLSTCTNCDPWCMRVQTSNTLQFIIDGYQAFTTPTTANGQDGLWHHHATVYDGTFLKYYFDGENVRTCTSGTCLFPSQPSDSITLGRSSKANSNHFCGYLSGIRVDNGLARYTSDFVPPSPDVQRGTRTVFLAGVKGTDAEQSGTVSLTTNTNVCVCTSTCLPEIKVCHTVCGGRTNSVFSCFGSMRMSRGGAGEVDPTSSTSPSIDNPFQVPGGGAGSNDSSNSGGPSGKIGYWSSTLQTTGGQVGYGNASTIYGTGGGGGSLGNDGSAGYRGGGGGGGGAKSTTCGYPAWTLRTSGHNKGDFYNYALAPVFGVGYAYGLWLLAGQFNSYTTSTDTIHWTSRTTGYGGGNFNFNFAYDGANTLALGSENGRIATSTDAIHFTKRTTGLPKSSSSPVSLKYLNNNFVSGHRNGQLQVSTDAIHWLVRTAGGDLSKDIESVAYGAGKYVYGNEGGQIATSTDTIHWTQRTIGATTTRIRGLTYANSQYLAAGSAARISVSTDAIHWTTRTAGLSSSVCLGEINYSNDIYHIIQNYGSRIVSSTDTIHWTLRTSNGGSFSGYAAGLTNNGKEYIAGGSSGLVSYLKLPGPYGCGGKGGDGFAKITWW